MNANSYILAHEASQFTNKLRIQEHEWDNVIGDCDVAISCGFSAGEIGHYVQNKLRVRRRDSLLREQAEQKTQEEIGRRLASFGQELQGEQSTSTIDSVEWTRPISKKQAAKYLFCPAGDKARWINQCVKDGTLKMKKHTRESYCFNLDAFPAEVRDKLRANS